jgi:predicted dehydrogenase
MQVITELNNDGHFTSGSCQEPSIGWQRVERTEEAQAVNEITAEGIDGDHAFGLEFAEGNMDGPLVGPRGAQTVIGEIDAFADAHAGRAEQEEHISAEIVAAHKLLLQELILFGGERSWQSVGRARDILAPQQLGQFSALAGACQLMEDGA